MLKVRILGGPWCGVLASLLLYSCLVLVSVFMVSL